MVFSNAAHSQTNNLEENLKDPTKVKRFAKYLHSNIRLREAVQINKRVNYFRGGKLFDVLLAPVDSKKLDKNRPICTNKAEAKLVGIALLKNGLIHASEVADKKRRELRPKQATTFEEDGYYTWIYEGSKTMRNLMLGLLVSSIIAMCLFPIWPQKAKVAIWYVSVTLLLFFFVLFTVRLVVYLVFWSIGFEFWIFPNFFDEDLGIFDSLRPIISLNRGEDLADSWFFRLGGVVGLVLFLYWCWQQPTDFDEMYASQMDFLSELYNGKLLQDPSVEEDLRVNAIPGVDELKKAIEQEEMGFDPDAMTEEEVDEDVNLEKLINASDEHKTEKFMEDETETSNRKTANEATDIEEEESVEDAFEQKIAEDVTGDEEVNVDDVLGDGGKNVDDVFGDGGKNVEDVKGDDEEENIEI